MKPAGGAMSVGEGVLERTGRWQIALIVLIGWNYTIVAINHALPTFHGYTPPFTCLDIESISNSSVHNSSCSKIGEECTGGYEFFSDRNEHSPVSEWSLVCDRRLLRTLVATLYFCGVTLGALLAGMAGDRFGRRPVMLTCLFCQGALGLSLYLVTELQVFIAIRFLQGFFVQGLQLSSYTLVMEFFPPVTRTAVGVCLEMFWALGLIILAGCAYFLPDWRLLELALTVPTLLAFVFVSFAPESARWLSTRGRHVEADKVLRQIAKRNGYNKTSLDLVTEDVNLNDKPTERYTIRTLNDNNPSATDKDVKDNSPVHTNGAAIVTPSPILIHVDHIPMIDQDSDDDHSGEKLASSPLDLDTSSDRSSPQETTPMSPDQPRRQGILDLFRHRLLRKFTLVLVLVWFSVSLSYYGIMFNLPDLSGDRHLNFFLGAILEAVAYGLSYIVLSRYGRRVPLSVYLIVSGALCAAVGGISAAGVGSSGPLAMAQTALALLGKGANVSAFCAIFIYTAELYPTVVRSAALGHCGFWGRVGSLCAPLLLLLGDVTTAVVPMLTMSVMVVLGGLATLLLPDTFNRPLADTIRQAKEMNEEYEKKRKSLTVPVET